MRITITKGDRYGHLTLTGNERKKKEREVEAICDCGKTTWAKPTLLRSGRKRSCGCGSRNSLGQWDFAKVTRIKQLVADGYGTKDLAEEYGVSVNTMHQVLWRYKIRLRPELPPPPNDPIIRAEFDRHFNRWFKDAKIFARNVSSSEDDADETLIRAACAMWERYSMYAGKGCDEFWKILKSYIFLGAKHIRAERTKNGRLCELTEPLSIVLEASDVYGVFTMNDLREVYNAEIRRCKKSRHHIQFVVEGRAS